VQEKDVSQRFSRWIMPFVGILAALLVGCAGDSASRRSSDSDAHARRSLDERGYQRRTYGPWDMPNQGTQPGPPTWYGCPQQASNCY